MTSRVPHVAILLEQAFSNVDECFGRVDLWATNRGGAPEQVEAIDCDLDRAERKDRRGRVILRELTGRCPRLGEKRDAAEIQVVGSVRGGFTDCFGDGEMALC